MINDLLTAHNALKYLTLYKDNWWIYSIIEQMQEQLNETLDQLYECSDQLYECSDQLNERSEELYRVKKENEMLRAQLAEIEKGGERR